MRRVVLTLTLLCVLGVAGANANARNARTSPPAGRLETGIVDQAAFSGADSEAAFAAARATGATVVRLILNWKAASPAHPTAEFRASDPGDPQYDWDNLDQQVREAHAQGLDPIVDIFDAPTWATTGTTVIGRYKPDVAKLAAFAAAAARRYDGSYDGLPRVRYWQLWDEPNLAWLLRPQYAGSTLQSPAIYRGMLNAFADAVHRVHPDNSVIAGGTSPFHTRAGGKSSWGPGPLAFMRDLLCLSKKLTPTCHNPATFDIWSHHPYTSGGPHHHAVSPDDVSLGDLPEMSATLAAAVHLHHVASRQKVRFWVDEFSWDTSPPDPNAVPIALQTRWVSEALYTMWKAGVSQVTWFLLKDEPVATSPYQSGLYFGTGRAKPTLTAFRFPFVAIKHGSTVEVWGRTPGSKRGSVLIQQKNGASWTTLGRLSASSSGLYGATYPLRGSAPLRATLVGSTDTSIPYSLVEPPDRSIRPFGEAK